MPYKSDAQRKFFHSAGAKKAGITKKMVKEFDMASKGMMLPKKKMMMSEPEMGKKMNPKKMGSKRGRNTKEDAAFVKALKGMNHG